jgi:hypothetical protein
VLAFVDCGMRVRRPKLLDPLMQPRTTAPKKAFRLGCRTHGNERFGSSCHFDPHLQMAAFGASRPLPRVPAKVR